MHLLLSFNIMSNHLTSVFLTSSSQFSIFHTLEKIETRYSSFKNRTFMNLSSLPVTMSPSAGRKTIASTEPSCQRRARRYLSGTFKIRTIAVSGPTEHCSIFHFPPPPPSVLRHRRDISTFLDILTVYTMNTIYFLNAYHLGW